MNYTDYAKNGICRFENFPECLNNPTEQALGESGGVQWYMRLNKERSDTTFAPQIFYKDSDEDAQIGVQLRMNIRNRVLFSTSCRGKHTLPPYRAVSRLTPIPISKVLEDLDDWLDNGAIVVEYGIQVESVKLNDGIWKFHLEGEVFHPNTKHELTIKFDNNPDFALHSSKHLLKFHSPLLSQHVYSNPMLSVDTIRFGDTYDSPTFEKCLQIAHGVRLRLRDWEFGSVIWMAEKLELQNVIRYCEQKLIESYLWPAQTDSTCQNRKRFMVHALKRMDSSRQFNNIYHYWEVDNLKPDIMRMILDKFMENDF